ncbi:hypothetical protein, partial [Chloroflexus sp.]|uniref:hypothetical protein n=1 Tax=Chloroflexus sp. TaxID=1904827 RepID=UPI00404A509F
MLPHQRSICQTNAIETHLIPTGGKSDEKHALYPASLRAYSYALPTWHAALGRTASPSRGAGFQP